jgi:membrane-bound lytic murein transglycosylase D
MTFKRKRKLLLLALASTLSACSTVKGDANNYTWNDILHPSTRHSTWNMMSERFVFKKDETQPLVKEKTKWYMKHPQYITLLTKNAKPYVFYIYQQTEKRKMPAEIALMPMVESNYNPFLFSPQGATGLWQIMPGTASGFHLKINWWQDQRRDTVASTNAALNYLSYLHRFFHGNWLLAMAAYNAGEGTVQQAIRHNKRLHLPTDYWHLALPAETKGYVPKMLALANIIDHAKQFDVKLSPVAYQNYFSATTIKGQYDLSYLAKRAGISIQELRLLNPAFRRFSTGPDFNDNFLIPETKLKPFQLALKNDANNHVTWNHHRVQPGDTLSALAHRYDTTSRIIKRINHLHSDTLSLKQNLLIPKSHNNDIHAPRSLSRHIAEDSLPGPQRIIHTVKANENLWTIAKQYHIRQRDIRFWNALSYTGALHVNQKLIIWKEKTHYKENYFIHTVRSGDTLSTIAEKFDTNVKLIKLYNNLDNTKIHVKQKLKIPYHKAKHFDARYNNQLVVHNVQPGDSIAKLAHYYRVSKADLIKWNHLNPKAYLRLGQSIEIYIRQEHRSS